MVQGLLQECGQPVFSLGRSPELRLDDGEDRAKISGTGVDIGGMGSSVLRHLCKEKKKGQRREKKNVR